MLFKIVALIIMSTGFSFFFTYLVIRLSSKKVVGQGERNRALHSDFVPRSGGIALIVSFLFGLGLMKILNFSHKPLTEFILLYLPLSIIVFLGVYDDLKGANAIQKLFFQCVCALFVYHFSFQIRYLSFPFIGSIRLGRLAPFVTVIWIVLLINAFNLIDGLDGLLSRIALYASLSFLFVFYHRHDMVMVLVFVLIASILAGFLYWNLYPAKVFLGDTGSMFLGFVFAVFSIYSSQKSSVAFSLSIPLVILIIPIVETVTSFLRRLANGKSPFKADFEHIHYKLLNRFESHKRASFVLSSLSGLFSALGTIFIFVGVKYRTLLVLIVIVGVTLLFFYGSRKGRENFHNAKSSQPFS